MNKRLLLLVIVLVLLLLNTAVQAQSPIGISSQTDRTKIMVGSAYRLSAPVLLINALASGGSYRLMPAAAGDGCCCKTFLPCVRK